MSQRVIIISVFLIFQSLILFAQTGLSAGLNIYKFRVADGDVRLKFHYFANAQSLSYPDANGRKASLELIILVSKAGEIVYMDKARLQTQILGKTQSPTGNIDYYAQAVLPQFSDYLVEVITWDAGLVRPDTLRASMHKNANFPKDSTSFSDIELISEKDFLMVSKNSKHQAKPLADVFYDAQVKKMCFYLESYPAAALQDTMFVALSTRISTQKTRQTPIGFAGIRRFRLSQLRARAMALDISDLASGNYQLVLEIIGPDGKIMAKAMKDFQRHNPTAVPLEFANAERISSSASVVPQSIDTLSIKSLRLYLYSSTVLASVSEQNSIAALKKNNNIGMLKNYLDEFWQRRSQNNNSDLAFLEFKEKVHKAQQLYATRQLLAYQTDRGRVYLMYGPASRKENEITDRENKSNTTNVAYEIWQYYKLEKGGQTNVIFVFAQDNMGDNNYRLLHSNAIGEIQNPDWRRNLASQTR